MVLHVPPDLGIQSRGRFIQQQGLWIADSALLLLAWLTTLWAFPLAVRYAHADTVNDSAVLTT